MRLCIKLTANLNRVYQRFPARQLPGGISPTHLWYALFLFGVAEMEGWFKIWRKLLDNKLWLSEKFTRGQAWVDLIGLANHDKGFIRKRGIRVDLNRGDIGWSERELSKRWKWSRGKTRRFLFELCSENEQKLTPQTEPQNKNITSRYSIINYERYQGNGPQSEPQVIPQTDHKQYQNKKDKNDKKKKNKVFLPEWINKDQWKAFKEMRVKLKKPMTQRAEELMIERLKKLKSEGHSVKKLLDKSIRKSWQDVYPDDDTKEKDQSNYCPKCGVGIGKIESKCPVCGERIAR